MERSSTSSSRERDEHPTVARLRAVSRLLDDAVRIPGTDVRVGLDPVLGILPVVGDSVAGLLSAYIIFEGYRADAPATLLAKMVALVAVDTVVGSIPVLGPVFDTFWKANTWNVDMLASHLESATADV